MASMVQTVTGAIPVSALGRTLMHEHLYISFAGAEYDPAATFDRPAFIAEAVRRLVEMREVHGVRSFVDPCPIELGRDAAMLREISEKSGMHIICTTGFYFEEMGLPPYWRARTTEEIADFIFAKSPMASAIPELRRARSRLPPARLQSLNWKRSSSPPPALRRRRSACRLSPIPRTGLVARNSSDYSLTVALLRKHA